MASVEDHLGADGVLRSLLSKTVNNIPYPLYPRTSAEIVNYGDSSVEHELNRLAQSLNNVIALVNDATTSLSTIASTRYTKSYIDEVVNGIRNNVSNLNITVIGISNTLNNLNYYSQSQIDQMFLTYTSQTNASLSSLNTQLTQLSTYFRDEYMSKAEYTSYHSDINSRFESIHGEITGEVNRALAATQLALNDDFRNALADYYTRDQVNSIDARLTRSINDTNIDLADLREETTMMNAADVSELKEHTNNIKVDIVNSQQTKLSQLKTGLDEKTDAQTEQLEQAINTIKGDVSTVNTNVASQFSAFNASLSEILVQNFTAISQQIAAINTGGGSSEGGGGEEGGGGGSEEPTPVTPVVPVIEYENADEVDY